MAVQKDAKFLFGLGNGGKCYNNAGDCHVVMMSFVSCICICIYMYTYVFVYVYICIHMYMYIRIYIYKYNYMNPLFINKHPLIDIL